MARPAPQTSAESINDLGLASAQRDSPRVSLFTYLQKDSVGGLALILAAALALLWANSPWASSYFVLRDTRIGYEPWHLNLTLNGWAADGLLAVFFFIVGLELKRELVSGELKRIQTAIVPIAAAIGGVAAPVIIYLLISNGQRELQTGWAIPTATDIAFAVAVLALVGSHLPRALRLFLLTLAVVDDLFAIGIIAIFYTDRISVIPLVVSLGIVGVYAVVAQRYRSQFVRNKWAAWVVLLPIGAVAWAFMHASGIHATIAGVLLGFAIPVLHRSGKLPNDSEPGLAEVLEHRFKPLSALIAVPLFAFFSAGVAIGGFAGLEQALTSPVSLAIVFALLIGKPFGILAAILFVTKIARVRLDPSLRWIDLAGVSLLAAIGFTVSLLIAELSFDADSAASDYAKIAILVASIIAASFAATLLGIRNRRYKTLNTSAGH
ncbi:MAG: Na+/H+ antiporter NhaA [Leucobacter sp.]